MSKKLGVMLCGHGSRDEDAVTEFAVLSEHLKKRLPQYPVEYGYLEFATPIIRNGLDALKVKGVERVLAVPGMLFAAGHAKNDIPSVLNTYAGLIFTASAMMMRKKEAAQLMALKSIQSLKLFSIARMTGLPILTGMIVII